MSVSLLRYIVIPLYADRLERKIFNLLTFDRLAIMIITEYIEKSVKKAILLPSFMVLRKACTHSFFACLANEGVWGNKETHAL
jgi:hypothetical protein